MRNLVSVHRAWSLRSAPRSNSTTSLCCCSYDIANEIAPTHVFSPVRQMRAPKRRRSLSYGVSTAEHFLKRRTLQIATGKRDQRVHVQESNGMTPDRRDDVAASQLGDGP